jgi:hypothetical protein
MDVDELKSQRKFIEDQENKDKKERERRKREKER